MMFTRIMYFAIQSFLDGYNLCIFAYGQTGSGKTYTMEGPPNSNSDDNEGIIPRAMKQVFQTIEDLKVAGWTVSNIFNHSQSTVRN